MQAGQSPKNLMDSPAIKIKCLKQSNKNKSTNRIEVNFHGEIERFTDDWLNDRLVSF